MIGRGKKVKFAEIFGANFAEKWPISWKSSEQISLEIDQFYADLTSVFNVFLTEIIICCLVELALSERDSKNAGVFFFASGTQFVGYAFLES